MLKATLYQFVAPTTGGQDGCLLGKSEILAPPLGHRIPQTIPTQDECYSVPRASLILAEHPIGE